MYNVQWKLLKMKLKVCMIDVFITICANEMAEIQLKTCTIQIVLFHLKMK